MSVEVIVESLLGEVTGGPGTPAQASVRPPARWAPGDDADDRGTLPGVFSEFDAEFAFTVDVAAAAHNTKCDRFYDRTLDGLAQSWAGESVWCNPPYSDIAPWIRKAWAEHTAAAAIVMLVPANRTEQPWWQTLVEPYRDRYGSALRTRFLPGRMDFLRPGQTTLGSGARAGGAPFGCVLLIWQTHGWTPGVVPPDGLFAPEA